MTDERTSEEIAANTVEGEIFSPMESAGEKKADAPPKVDARAAAEAALSVPEVAEAPTKIEASPSDSDAVSSAETEEEGEEDEDILQQDFGLRPVPDDGIVRRWYAVHAHSGQESNVRKSIMLTAEQTGLAELISNVFVPMEEVAEFKSGEKKLSKRKYFPGYVLVQLPEHPEKNPDLWHLIKDTPGVTGFIGSRNEPVPLEDDEVNSIIEEIRGERERPRPKVLYESGERIKIIDGPFSNFMGNIDEINEERGKLKVLIEIFERQTSVEVEFWQVEKI